MISNRLLVQTHHRCCICKTDDMTPQIHHVDGNPANNDPDNLVPLCPNCQSRVHTKFGLTRSYTQPQLRMYRDDWFRLCAQTDRFAAGLPVSEEAVPTDWIVTYGVNTHDLLESEDLPEEAPNGYPSLCDWLQKDLEARLQKTGIHNSQIVEDARNGETFSMRIRFEWNPLTEKLNLDSDLRWWELLELLPYSSAYPE